MDSEIYEPQEDSFLLKKYVQEYAKGFVLDVGTGSGIQAEAAAKKADFVIGVDINQKALTHCCMKYKSEKIMFVKSDLFEFFEKKHIVIKNGLFTSMKDFDGEYTKFDLIIFNPPYLPKDEKDEDVALDGGKEGYELIERFLNEVGKFLKDDGKVLMIFSSFTNKEKVDSLIEKNNLKAEELEKVHVFFEDIILYKIEKN